MKNRHNTQPQPSKNKLYSAVDKAPFAGKFLVKDVYVGYSTSEDKMKQARGLGAVAFLAGMSAVHAYQAKLGAESLMTHVPEMLEHGDAKDIALTTFDSVYVSAMSAVALRQASLTKDVVAKHYNWIKERKIVPEVERKVKKTEYKHKKSAIALAMGVTLAGQLGAAYSMIDAHDQEFENYTQKSIDEQLQKIRDQQNDIYDSNTVYLTRQHNTDSAHRTVAPDDKLDK